MSIIQGKAAVFFEAGRPIEVVDVNFLPPKCGEVRVKIKASGICHSDLHPLSGESIENGLPRGHAPVVLGHEGAGIVESVGEGVNSVSVGDHVILLWLQHCQSCDLCKKSNTNFCRKLDWTKSLLRCDGTSRIKISKDGTEVLTFLGTATFAEYAVLEECLVCKIPDGIPWTEACIFGCAVGTGYGSATNIAKVVEGSTCAIWGLGAVGLSAVIGCAKSKAERIIGIDINPEKFPIAMEVGATECINPSDKDIIKELTKSDGVDYGFECSGVESCFNQAQKSIAIWGKLILVGLQQKIETVESDFRDIVSGKTVTGGFYGGYKARDGVNILCQEYFKGNLKTSKLITHQLKLEEINEGIQLLQKGKSIRSVILM